ncbi:putative leucine-rich repeat domain, L domain-containing protein [Medicago truncatula]|uniref:Putative leucine-rich repeat domain, L domain-containing protein n=1 Tax=Medicago truncatula TaxID=3880 RepID=A0A396HDL9_MEDTR|nr:putative leucine-rich repeat domain, L domain-containing protein [Medicago truncatula]
MSALRLSYFNLKLSLRPCFTFCAVFPKDFKMVKENLIQLWMANGLVTSRGNLQMEHVGNEVWNELNQRSFFQEVKSDFVELQNLQLGGKLHIKRLHKVSNEEDARKANLIGKKDLNRLYLSWGDYINSQVSSVDAERVLEALEPHSGLKSFGVQGYTGTQFPPWMRNTSILKGLVHIILYDCKNVRQLPLFGKLPCLTYLYVSGMKDLKYIDNDLHEPATEKAFTSLKKLTLSDLPNLERVLEAEGVEMLPQLLKLDITDVPKLALQSLPSVESLSVSGGNEELLKSFFYNNCNEEVASSSREISGNNLKSLCISKFAKLMELPVELSRLGALDNLKIAHCDEMESLSEHLLQGLRSLRTLAIHECGRFKSLSNGMRHLTCLETLEIYNCPQLVSLDNMNSLTSLRRLVLWESNENILDGIEGIPSLQKLKLFNFPSLKSLPDCLGAMTSLQVLDIYNFPKVKSLPDNFQQLQNLQSLRICGCPMLEKRCKRGIGEDWHKIAHIPQIELNFELQSDAEPTSSGEDDIATWMQVMSHVPTIDEDNLPAWAQYMKVLTINNPIIKEEKEWERVSKVLDYIRHKDFDSMIEDIDV